MALEKNPDGSGLGTSKLSGLRLRIMEYVQDNPGVSAETVYCNLAHQTSALQFAKRVQDALDWLVQFDFLYTRRHGNDINMRTYSA